MSSRALMIERLDVCLKVKVTFGRREPRLLRYQSLYMHAYIAARN